MARYGYARVSTRDQLLDVQIEQLQQQGNIARENIFSEKITGVSKHKEREEFLKLFNQLEVGDQIVVTKLDRLGRNTLEMLNLLKQLEEKQVAVISLSENLDTTGPTGKLILTILAAVAEMERARITERTKEGREYAQLKGVKFGRKRKVNYKAVEQLKAEGKTNREIMELLNISKQHLNYINKFLKR